MENYHLSIHMAFWKESMINRLSNLINRNRSAAKISQVLCSNVYTTAIYVMMDKDGGVAGRAGERVNTRA